jgi:hypothetical protein
MSANPSFFDLPEMNEDDPFACERFDSSDTPTLLCPTDSGHAYRPGVSLFPDSASSITGDHPAFDEAGLGDDSGDLARARRFAAQLDQAQRQDLSRSRTGSGKRTSRSTQARFITAEDFEEGIQRDAYILIETYSKKLLLANSSAPKRNEALRFFFIRDENAIDFQDCCEAIDPNIRPGVILLRLQYEFWLRWFVLASPLPGSAIDLPFEAQGLASYIADNIGVTLAREAWFQPGLDSASLVDRTRSLLPPSLHDRIKPTLIKLSDANVLSFAEPDHWYVTGRNPALYSQAREARLSTITWSALF